MLSEAAGSIRSVMPTTNPDVDSYGDIPLCQRLLLALILEKSNDNGNHDTESNGYGSPFEDETDIKSNGFMEFSDVVRFGLRKSSFRSKKGVPAHVSAGSMYVGSIQRIQGIGYGILKVYGGYGVFMSAVSSQSCFYRKELEDKMSLDVITVGLTMRISLLYRGEYSQWSERFMNYHEEQTDGEAMINSIKNGEHPLPVVAYVSLAETAPNARPTLKDPKFWTAEEKKTQKINHALERKMHGSEYGEQDRKTTILYEYETFRATEGEQLLDTYLCYLQVINDLKKYGYKKDNCELNYKFLNNLQPEWKQYGPLMRQTKNLMDINIDALYNILKQNQGDVNDDMGYKKKAVVFTSDPLALVADKTKVSKRKEKVVVQSESEGSDDEDISDLKKITALLAKSFNRKKYYAKPTNNNLRTSSASSSANKKPEYVKSAEKKEDKKADEKKRDMSKVKCYNCNKEGSFAKECKKAKVKDYNYYKTKMLLAKKDSDEQVILAKDQAWMEASSDSDQEINANIVFMAKMEKVLSDLEESSSSVEETIAEQTSSLKPYVLTVILEKIIIDLEDEVVSLLEKEKENLEIIESLKSKDTLSSVRRPKHSGVIWKKKWSSNTFNVDLSSVSILKLNKYVKRYSRKDLLSCNNSHHVDTRSAYACNNAMNVSCNSRLYASCDVNDLFVFDDHMTGNRTLLTNFVEKFFGTVCFDNNDFTVIAGYGNVVIGSMTIKKVYYVEGLGHNLFSVGQFCDKGLEVTFRKSTCFVRNEDGVDLLTGDRSSIFYTIAHNKIASKFSTCLIAKASSSQSWLWHQRLSRLNFVTIHNFVKNNLVRGLPKMQFEKDHLCSACEQRKIHRKHHKFKTTFASNKPLHLLHMDLCGLMHVKSINEKRYVLVVVYDYSRYTWVFFLHSKDEGSEVIILFIKKTQVNLQLQVQRVRTDNGTEFKNKTLAKFFDEVRTSQQFHAAKTPQQNGVVERRNRILVEALKENGDIGVFVGYSKEFAALRVYNNRKSSNPSVSKVSESSKKDLEDLFQNFYDEYFDASKITKSPTTNVGTSNDEISSHEEVFHESSESFQEEYSSSSLNADVQQSSEEVIVPSSNTQSISNNMVSNVNEEISSHNVYNERLEDAYFDVSTTFHDPSNVHTFYQPYPHEKNIEPANVAKALKDADWVSAMQDKLDQFAILKVWRLVSRPEGKTIIKTKWIFKNKKDESIARTKAIHLFFAYAADKDFTVFQMDLKTTFLNGILKEEVYVGQPPGYVRNQYPDHVYALDKALYSLKQAPRALYDVLLKFLINSGFQKGSIDTTIFIKKGPDIMFATCMCTRYQANPNEHHVSAVKRIFRYLKWTINLGLWYSKDSGFDLTAYSDADHARCHLDRKTEAKYVAVFGCCAQVLWMRT
nr:retrovirus-related Pol polyprotein from transposon TNT 1-94 [Tanacetum cinerariifolium]